MNAGKEVVNISMIKMMALAVKTDRKSETTYESEGPPYFRLQIANATEAS
jgi:hypothetical protein